MSRKLEPTGVPAEEMTADQAAAQADVQAAQADAQEARKAADDALMADGMTPPDQPKPKKMKSKTLRAWAAALVFVFVAVGLMVHSGTGTPSSFGWNYISGVCPLASLEALFGTWAFVPRLAIAFAAVVIIVVFVGKAFCAWGCPIPHIQDIFKTKKVKGLEASERQESADRALARWQKGSKPKRKKVDVDSRHAVLGGTLLTTAIFGFPVFCAICPIGLTFGTFILLWRFVQFNDPSWGLLVFPIIIILEVVVLRKWCGRICPIGALLSLVSTFNGRFRPTIDHEKCLRDTSGTACMACDVACPEKIDPYGNLGDRGMEECVKCRRCADACPVSAITLPFKKRKMDDAVSTSPKSETLETESSTVEA